MVGSTDSHSSHPQGHEPDGRGAARAEDAQETPAQSHILPSMLVYEEKNDLVTPELDGQNQFTPHLDGQIIFKPSLFSRATPGLCGQKQVTLRLAGQNQTTPRSDEQISHPPG